MKTSLTRQTLTLIVGDIAALLLFVFIGQRDHSVVDTQPVLRLLSTAAYFAVPYLIAGWLLGAFHPSNTTALFTRAANAWLIAAPIGVLARSFLNGSGVILSPFLFVTLSLGLAFLCAWRGIYLLISRRKTHAG
jgi:hypothetical protein